MICSHFLTTHKEGNCSTWSLHVPWYLWELSFFHQEKATSILSFYEFWENWEANRARSLCWCPAEGRTNKLNFPLTPKNTPEGCVRKQIWCCLWHCWLLLPLLCDAPWCSSSSWDPVLWDTSYSWPLVPLLLGLAFKDPLSLPRAGGNSGFIAQSLWFSSQKKQQFLKTSTSFQRGLFLLIACSAWNPRKSLSSCKCLGTPPAS